MPLTIDGMMAQPGPAVYYTAAFQRVLETHLKYLREHRDTTPLPLNAHDTYKFEGDLNGLLRKHGIATEYHWVIMRMNGLTHVNQLDGSITHLLIPSTAVVDEIRQRYVTTLPKRRAS